MVLFKHEFLTIIEKSSDRLKYLSPLAIADIMSIVLEWDDDEPRDIITSDVSRFVEYLLLDLDTISEILTTNYNTEEFKHYEE